MGGKVHANKFFSRIEKHIAFQSDPIIIKQILTTLNLHELKTSDQDFQTFLLKILTQPINLTALLEHVKTHILANEPLCTLLAYIQENDLISDEELAEAAATMQLQVNLLCLFEAMTISMANSNCLAQEIYDHINKRSGTPSPGNPMADFFLGVPYNTTFFERLKLISIKPGLLNILFHRMMGEKTETKMDVDAFIAQKRLVGWNAQIYAATFGNPSAATIPGMGVNILEAAWEDSTGYAKDRGGLDNAKAGTGLIALMEEKQYLSHFELVERILPKGVSPDTNFSYPLLPDLTISNTKKKVSQFNVDSQWRDLYSSWNLLFVVSNINSVLMPLKLLLPTVFSSEPQNYKEVRLLSLFLFGNLFLHENVKSNPLFTIGYSLQNSAVILKKWGEINKEYANKLLHDFCPNAVTDVEPVYQNMLGNKPHLNFIWHLLFFSYNTEQYRFTKHYSTQNGNASKNLFFASAAPTTPYTQEQQSSNENRRTMADL